MNHFMLLIDSSIFQEECQQQQGVKKATVTPGCSKMGREYGVENKKRGSTHGEEEQMKRGSRGHT